MVCFFCKFGHTTVKQILHIVLLLATSIMLLMPGSMLANNSQNPMSCCEKEQPVETESCHAKKDTSSEKGCGDHQDSDCNSQCCLSCIRCHSVHTLLSVVKVLSWQTMAATAENTSNFSYVHPALSSTGPEIWQPPKIFS